MPNSAVSLTESRIQHLFRWKAVLVGKLLIQFTQVLGNFSWSYICTIHNLCTFHMPKVWFDCFKLGKFINNGFSSEACMCLIITSLTKMPKDHFAVKRDNLWYITLPISEWQDTCFFIMHAYNKLFLTLIRYCDAVIISNWTVFRLLDDCK